MFWLMLSLLVIAAVVLNRRRRAGAATDDEPWRASLEADDEPLDLDEIREAEEEWFAEEWEGPPEEDDWR